MRVETKLKCCMTQVEQTIGGEIELLKEMWSSRDYHVNLVKFINSEKCLEFQKPPAS